MKNNQKNIFSKTEIGKPLLAANIIASIAYFIIIAFWFERGNAILFWTLIAGEIFHLWQILTYCHTVWETKYSARFNPRYSPKVDVFITVAGEPVEVVEETALAAKNIDYPNFEVHILNDGLVAKKENWMEIEEIAAKAGVNCITRRTPGGAKAGNINHALGRTSGTLVAVFDADHVPHADFLKKTVGYFADPEMAFVQTPQYYRNHAENQVTAASWEQQELFFGPICKGKNRLNSAFMCGTCMVVKRAAFNDVGGLAEDNIAEDFLTSLFMHERGWKSLYVPEILAEGLAPEDLYSYAKQQFRWARGALELVFRYNPFLRRGLTLAQRIEYLASASYWLSGAVVLMNAIFPLVFFFTGQVPFAISTMTLAAIFIPYMFLTVTILRLSSNYTYTFQAVAFSMSSFSIHLRAALAVILGRKNIFEVTSKKKLSGNFLYLTIPHLVYIGLVCLGFGFAVMREGLDASVAANLSWASFNIAVFFPFISASLPSEAYEQETETKKIPASA